MVVKKPRIVIIGAGMAGLVAANKLYTCPGSKELFEICIVEGGSRIGGRINTWEFDGDRIELGATWIHGIGGSPIYRIAEEIGALESKQPWEHKDGYPNTKELLTVMEGGYRIDPSTAESVSKLYRKMMEFAQGELNEGSENKEEGDEVDYYKIAAKAYKICTSNGYSCELGLGSFLRKCLDVYWVSKKDQENNNGYCNLNRKLLEDAVFAIYENAERAHTSAGDLSKLDYNAESEYLQFPDEEITIAKGYLSIIDHLASVLPPGLIQLGRKVRKIEWKCDGMEPNQMENGNGNGNGSTRPVKLHFEDESVIFADHVIITVSLGVLKAGIRQESGKEALELESLNDEEIINGVTTTISSFLPLNSQARTPRVNSHQCSNNGNGRNCMENSNEFKFTKIINSRWGTDPLFLGSYSYVEVGSSGDDLDTMAEPLPRVEEVAGELHPLQILFAGEATHRRQYSTTHGAYFSGEREANRLLKHYKCDGF